MPVKGPALFLKARSAWWLPVLCAAAALAAAAVPDTLVHVPLRENALMFPRLATAAVPAGLAYLAMRAPGRQVERNPPILRVARLAWFPAVTACLTACSTLPLLHGGGPTAAAVARNAILLVGIGALSGLLLGYDLAWAAPLAAIGITVLFGTRPLDGSAYPWAVIDRPPDDPISWAVTISAATAAWCLYGLLDLSPQSRSLRRPRVTHRH